MTCCEKMEYHINQEDNLILYNAKYREYGMRSGGDSYVLIHYCPWCGKKLPDSLRAMWFDKLEIMGIDPAVDTIPLNFNSDAWWKDKMPSD